MKINWNFLAGGGVQNKKRSVGGVWIFSGTAQFPVQNTVKALLSPRGAYLILGPKRGGLNRAFTAMEKLIDTVYDTSNYVR